ncbi:MAG: glycosyltransferase family 39 protein [Candidatus Microgenomates bacterium]
MIYLILILGLGLRLISLNQSFWLDEATSATVARDFNFSRIITQFSPGDFHPPLYYLLLKIWTLPFGISEISARSFSIVCALLSIFLVYVLGRKLKDKSSGLMAAFLMAVSPLFIYFSQEARMYALETLLVLIAVYLFIKFLNKTNLILATGLFFTIAVLGLTDYLPLTILPVFWLVAILSHKSQKWWIVFISMHIIPILAFLWWSPILIRQLTAGLGVQTTSLAWWQVLGGNSLKELLLVPVKFMIGRISFASKIIYGLVVIVTGILFVLPLVVIVKRIKTFKLVIVWLLLPLLLAYLVSFVVPVFSYFRLLFILPAFYLLISLGLSYFPAGAIRPYLIVLVILNVVFAMVYLTNSKFQREDWRGMSDFITQESLNKKAEVLFVSDGQMEAYRYYNRSVSSFGPSGFNQADDLVWLSRYVQPMFDPEDKLKQEIEDSGYKKLGEYNFNGVVVWKYEK